MPAPREIEITEKTPVKLSYTVLVALIAALMTLTGAAYGAREDVFRSIRSATSEQLKGYVSHEEFLQWQLAEGSKRDQQFRVLLEKLEQVRKR